MRFWYRLRSGRWRDVVPFRLSLLGAISFTIALLYLHQSAYSSQQASISQDLHLWQARREEVKDAFAISWGAYKKYAWGCDNFHPISKNGSQMSPSGLGWIIIDALDTMMIMNMTEEMPEVREWISRNLTYNQHQDVNTFETTIRMLGGLLSAHYLSTVLPDVASKTDYMYLIRSVDLADRLLGAYDTKSGIPFASTWLDSGTGDGGVSSTAEASTLQMEMKYLAQLTGDEQYWRKAEQVIQVLDDNGAKDGLLPVYVDPHSGRFTSREIRLGSRGDSYYEYLVKQYLQTGEMIYLDMWEQALSGIQKHMIVSTKVANLQYVAELPNGVGGRIFPKMDHLVCFLPGSIALGVTEGKTVAEAKKLPSWNIKKEKELHLARELTKTCFAMYEVTATGLAPEIAFFNTDESLLNHGHRPSMNQTSSSSLEDWKEDIIIKPLDSHNLQRPELVESLLLMYRITEDPIYRQWGWKIFRAFQTHALVDDGEGFTSLDNVTMVPPTKRDNMESFWLAETLKYFYLLFSPIDYLPLTEIVFNTEAHVLPRIKEPRFDAGWNRKQYFTPALKTQGKRNG